MANKKEPISVTHPELAAQADGWDPTTLMAGSNKEVGWKCESGHVWTSTVNNRSKGSGCPVCSGRQVLVGYNDLETTNPELAAQADGWDPTTGAKSLDAFCAKILECEYDGGKTWWDYSSN